MLAPITRSGKRLTQACTWIALFRGINVGGTNIIPMQELRALFIDLGFEEPRSYIQSGNIVFRASSRDRGRLTAGIQRAVMAQHGFEPTVLLLDIEALTSSIARNPYPHAEPAPKSLHLYFFAEAPQNPDLEALNQWCSPTEQFALIDAVGYLDAPDGIGRSKLAARVEKLLGSATARNWRTVTSVLEIANHLEEDLEEDLAE